MGCFQWLSSNKDGLTALAALLTPVWTLAAGYLGSRLTLVSQRGLKEREIEVDEQAKCNLSSGLLGLAMAEAIQNTRLLVYLHQIIEECCLVLRSGADGQGARSLLSSWLTANVMRNGMWIRLTSSDVVAEKKPNPLANLAWCYNAVEMAVSHAQLLSGRAGDVDESALSTLMQFVGQRCSESAAEITVIVFENQELWDSQGVGAITLLAEMDNRGKGLKAGLTILDERMAMAVHEVIASYGEHVSARNPAAARACSEALNALELRKDRLTRGQIADLQASGHLPIGLPYLQGTD